MLLHRDKQWLGSAAVDGGGLVGLGEQAGQVEQAGLVLGVDGHLLRVRCLQVLAERHRGAGATAVDQLPLGAGAGHLLDHGQDNW
jgi:hypothetical protein